MKFGASVLALFAFQGTTAFQPAAPKSTETALFSLAGPGPILRKMGASGAGATVCRFDCALFSLKMLLIAFFAHLSPLFFVDFSLLQDAPCPSQVSFVPLEFQPKGSGKCLSQSLFKEDLSRLGRSLLLSWKEFRLL
jgi:hypothetical protein